MVRVSKEMADSIEKEEVDDLRVEVNEMIFRFLNQSSSQELFDVIDSSDYQIDEYKHRLEDPSDFYKILQELAYSVLVKEVYEELDEEY